MKFCNLLLETAQEIPDVQVLYDHYKRMKKTLKGMECSQNAGHVEEAAQLQSNFVLDLKTHIQEMNERFMEEEELRVIEISNLEEQAGKAETEERCFDIANRFVDFHGEMLLFINSAMLGYTSLLKILKKYTKKTGNQVIEFQRDRLARMPICSTEIASSIANRAERTIDRLLTQQTQLHAAAGQQSKMRSSEPRTGNRESERVSTLLGQVRVAIHTWEQLKNTAVSPSTILTNHLATFSIPSISGSVSISSRSSSVRSDAT